MAREKLRLREVLLLLFLLLLTSVESLYSSPISLDSLSHRLSIELRPAYNLVTNYEFHNHDAEGDKLYSSLSLHARYALSFDNDSRIGSRYPTTYQGIGIAGYSFGDHSYVGTPIAIYIFQGAHITDFNDALSLGYEWNFGYSWGWHPNAAMNSKWNVLISVALPFTWHINSKWDISLIPDFTHLSNGDTSFPNAGANLIGIRIGATRLFNDQHKTTKVREYAFTDPKLSTKTFGERLSYDIILYGGWRADRFTDDTFYVINKPHPLGGLQFQTLFHANHHFAIGASIDAQYDSSLNLYATDYNPETDTATILSPSMWQQTEVGLSLRGEITAPIFSVGVGFGVNLFKHGYDMSRIYTQFSLKAFITKRMFLYIGYRYNSKQYTHNLMYGLGIRIQKR